MNPRQIEQVIVEIKEELPRFSIKESSLERFDLSSRADTEFLSYVNGTGGSYVKFLALLVQKLSPKNIVELGNREGISTLAMYDQLPADSHFTTIDIIEDQRYCPEAMFTDERVSFIFGDVCSLDVIKQVPFDIDLLFSDTIHFDFQIRDEFAIYQHLLADTALVAIDDIHTNDKGLFWDSVTSDKWDLTELCHTPGGWGLFLYVRKEPLDKETRWKLITEATALIWERKYTEIEEREDLRASRTLKSRAKELVKTNPFLYRTLVSAKNSLDRTLKR